MPEWLASQKMWGEIFVVGVPIAEKVLRPALVYVFLVVALRVFGKRELDSVAKAVEEAMIRIVDAACQ